MFPTRPDAVRRADPPACPRALKRAWPLDPCAAGSGARAPKIVLRLALADIGRSSATFGLHIEIGSCGVRATAFATQEILDSAPLKRPIRVERACQDIDGLAGAASFVAREPRPGSDVNLLGQRQRIVDLDPEVSDGALELRVSEQELNRSEVSGLAVNLRRFRPAH